MKSVDTIIPVHRKQSYLERCITSVLNQDYKNNKIYVVVNTPDEKVYQWINSQFGNEINILNSPNIGSSAARNYGIIKSESEYVAFLDSDDIWYKSKLTEQINFMKESSLEISGTTMFYRTEENLSRIVIGKPNFKIDDIKNAEYAPFPLSTLVIKRSIIVENNMFSEGLGSTKYGQVEDVELYSRLAVDNDIGILNKPLGEYLINNKSATDLYFIKQRNSLISLGIERKNNNFSKLEKLNNFKNKKTRAYSEFIEYKVLLKYIDGKYIKSSYYFFVMLLLKPITSLKKINQVFKRSF